MKNRIVNLFNIEYPIIQAGMVWCSGWSLAAAVSNAGGLGIIGAGSMSPEILREHIQKCHANTHNNFAVNIPLFSKYTAHQIDILIEENLTYKYVYIPNRLSQKVDILSTSRGVVDFVGVSSGG